MTFGSAVSDLRARTGCSLEKAEELVREQMPHLVSAVQPRDESVIEKQEQVEIRKLLIAYGFRVYNLSQSRPSKIGIGLPDIWFAHQRLPVAGWFEVKRQRGGTLSAAQQLFREECERCNVLHCVGDRWTAVDMLLLHEVAVRGDGVYGIEPVRHLSAESA